MSDTNPTPDRIPRRAVLEAIEAEIATVWPLQIKAALRRAHNRIAALPAVPVAVAPEAPQPALDVAGLVQKQQDFLAEQLRQQLSACREQLLVLANENDTLATQLAEAERERDHYKTQSLQEAKRGNQWRDDFRALDKRRGDEVIAALTRAAAAEKALENLKASCSKQDSEIQQKTSLWQRSRRWMNHGRRCSGGATAPSASR